MITMTEKRISSELVFDGKLIRVRVDRVELPSGRMGAREVVEHPGAVAILPVRDDGRMVLVRQFRYAIGRSLLEVPAGTREPNEDALATAIRELHEEVGLRADHVEPLVRFLVSPGWCNEELLAYRATGLHEIGATPEEDEEIEIVEITPDEVPALIAAGEIADAKTITSIYAHLRG